MIFPVRLLEECFWQVGIVDNLWTQLRANLLPSSSFVSLPGPLCAITESCRSMGLRVLAKGLRS